MLIPKYKQKVKTAQPITQLRTHWDNTAVESLQNCFETTDWNVFRDLDTDIHQYTDTVTDYIKFCETTCIPTTAKTTYPNSNAWYNKQVSRMIKAKDRAYRNRSNDPVTFRKAKLELKKCIRDTKRKHSDKIKNLFKSRDSKKLWSHIGLITQYKGARRTATSDDVTLPDKLNEFYARFDRDNSTTPTPLPCNSDTPLRVTEKDTLRVLSRLRENKAAGPDEIKPRLLKSCCAQLAPVFTNIYNWSLETCTVPSCLKVSTIVPVPKKASPSTLNDYRPVALTSVIMKCFESLVLNYINSLLPPQFDSFQFAYRENRSVDDAIAINVHEIANHLESRKSYARVLFIDYSSAFNTIIPQKLYNKLLFDLSFPLNICNWILDFLLNRPQFVKIGSNVSSTTVLNTGTPQGCPLSPKLYSLFTFDCQADSTGSLVVKFADDTTVSGFIINNDETCYRNQVSSIVEWCKDNNLFLNVSKTKELIVDFRRKKTPLLPLTIGGETVEQVESFKFLGTHISNNITWDVNCTAILKRARQRLYFLRKLKSFNVSCNILVNFYRTIIESVLTQSILVWFDGVSKVNLDKLDAVVRNAEKIIGVNLPSLESIYEERMGNKIDKILQEDEHPARHYFELLPHGRRFRAFKGSARFVKSFFPQAVKHLNNTRAKRCTTN